MRRFVGIDPSTKTGFVAMDEVGNVLTQKELTGVGKEDPYRMVTLINEVIDHLKREDIVCIEGFGFASEQAIQLGGIGWAIRMALFRRGIKYYEVAPASLKKYIQANGRTGPDGKAIKGKKAVAIGVDEHFGYTHPSDNVIDAYVLAQIAYAMAVPGAHCTDYQLEVIKTVLKPASEKKAEKAAAKRQKKEKAKVG